MHVNKKEIYDKFLSLIQVKSTVSDIGSKDGQFLLPFYERGFRKLIGIDSDHTKSLIPGWSWYLTSQHGIAPKDTIEWNYKNKVLFDNPGKKIEEYDFTKDTYSVIFCRHVLHFVEKQKQLELIDIFYKQLDSGGLMCLRVNNQEHNSYTKHNPKPNITYHGDGVIETSQREGFFNEIRYYFKNENLFLNKKL